LENSHNRNTIINCFLPVVDGIDSITLVGMGETLIDTGLIAKINYLKSKGVKNACLPTNASLLNRKVSQGLLNAELDEIIFGVDSLDKETYENIRKQLVFENIMQNVHRFIEMRNQGHFKTRVLVRMIVQRTNAEQWDDYKILCMVETPSPSLPSDCQKRLWANGTDTFRADYLPPACHLL